VPNSENTEPTGVIESLSLDELAHEVEHLRSRIEELLVGQFDRAKIPTSPAVQFDTSPNGDVRVSGDHPQLHEIQRLIESQSELNTLFQSLTDSVQQLAALQQRRELQQYLSENPGATATNLIAPPPSRFAATLAGDRLSIDVTQEPLNRVS